MSVSLSDGTNKFYIEYLPWLERRGVQHLSYFSTLSVDGMKDAFSAARLMLLSLNINLYYTLQWKLDKNFEKKEITWHFAIIKGYKKCDNKTQWKRSCRYWFPYPDYNGSLNWAVLLLWAYSVSWWIFLFMSQQRAWDESTSLAKKGKQNAEHHHEPEIKQHYSSFKQNQILATPGMRVHVFLDASCLKRHTQGRWHDKRMKPGSGFVQLGCARLYTKEDSVKETLYALFHIRLTATLQSEVTLLFSFYSWRNWVLKRLSNLPKDTQLESDRGGFTHICFDSKDYTFNHH